MAAGVLALQGAVTPHLQMLEKIGVKAIPVRSPSDLETIDRIILPGGESTTMLKLLDRTGLFEPLAAFGRTKPIWGVCAGAILIAKEVRNPDQRSLRLMNISAERNHYGSQRESFKAEIKIEALGETVEGDFIRAPLLNALSPQVKTLGTCGADGVFFQEGKMLASSFHVELGNSTALHEYFVKF